MPVRFHFGSRTGSNPPGPSPGRHPGRSLVLASLLVSASMIPVSAQYVLIDDTGRLRGEAPGGKRGSPPGDVARTATVCGLAPVAWDGEPVPGGGTLATSASGTPVSVNGAGQAVFYSRINGALRNQGIFVKDASGLKAIAIGCGGYLGSGNPGTACGDPAPIGGTFTGFYPGSGLPPSINDLGDVLFLSDVHGGSSPRGLFLHRGATGAIVKVAAIGDPSPVGTLAAVGTGSINNKGEVVFLGGRGRSNRETAVLHWKDGVMRAVVAPGDQVPGGRVYSLVWIGDVPPDGSYVPLIEVPDINDAGAVSFHALLESGAGLYVSRDGVHEAYVVTGQASPVGGVFFNLYAPILNEAGEIAFQGEYLTSPWTVGWFVGRPGKWREVISFYDRILGGQAWGIAVSHNPQQPLDDEGNLIVWTDVRLDDGTDIDAVHIGYADGTLETIAVTGDPSPLGGTLRELHPWPTLEARRCGLGASLLGVPGLYSAHLDRLKRPLEVTGLAIDMPDPGEGFTPMSWDLQGMSTGTLVHDLLRGKLTGFTEPARCAADGITGTSWKEPAPACEAAPGDGCWYLVRAKDSCGRGPYGAWGTVCIDPCGGGQIPGCPICGNGVIEGAEACDGGDLAGETCTSQGFDGGTLACGADCTLDRSGCTTICGDGIIRGDEDCDGANLRGYRCGNLGFGGGVLTCTATCDYDLTGCCCTDGTPGCPVCPVCGDGVRQAPYELCDGSDTGGETCWSQGHPPGILGCNHRCDQFDFSGCVGN